jgi:hypothetical protein
MNPFTVKTYEKPEYFFDRIEETARLTDAIFNERNITLFSHRRFGKTMLLHHVFTCLDKRKYEPVYIDLFATGNLIQLAQKVSAALYDRKIIQKNKLKKILGSLGASLTFDPLTGNPELRFNLLDKPFQINNLHELFACIKESGKQIVMALDEFQELAGYEEENAEAVIRTLMQDFPGVTFIFSGSKKSLIKEMFTNPNRPFFQSTQMMELKEIERETYASEIFKILEKYGKKYDPQVIFSILDETYCHTGFTQMVLSRVYSDSKERINHEIFQSAWLDILEDHKSLARELEYLLSSLQWRTLLAIAAEEYVRAPQSYEFISRHGLSSPSSMSRVIESLLDKGLIIDAGDKGLRLYNVFIQKNLKRLYH